MVRLALSAPSLSFLSPIECLLSRKCVASHRRNFGVRISSRLSSFWREAAKKSTQPSLCEA